MNCKMELKKIFVGILLMITCWIAFVAFEGFRLVGSIDAGKYPLIVVGSTQIQDELAVYHSLGFSQVYHLASGDTFVYGEFKVLGVRLYRWDALTER